MNYELAKQLKDAGFPHNSVRFHGQFVRYLNGFECARDKQHLANEELYHPTLSELIEACPKTRGDATFSLTSWGNGEGWMASYREMTAYEPDSDNLRQDGSTPEEAVARLWLALNTKS